MWEGIKTKISVEIPDPLKKIINQIPFFQTLFIRVSNPATLFLIFIISYEVSRALNTDLTETVWEVKPKYIAYTTFLYCVRAPKGSFWWNRFYCFRLFLLPIQSFIIYHYGVGAGEANSFGVAFLLAFQRRGGHLINFLFVSPSGFWLLFAGYCVCVMYLLIHIKNVVPLVICSELALDLSVDSSQIIQLQDYSTSLEAGLSFSFFLYALGLLGRIVNRKNFIVTRRAVERRYLGAITSFVLYGTTTNDPRGSIYGLLLVILAACESAVGLGIILVLHRFGGSISFQDYEELGG